MTQVRPVVSMPAQIVAALIAMRNGPLPHRLGSKHVTIWNSARIALWQAAPALGLRPGQSVAVPAFCCGSELEPFLAAGFKLSFFGIGGDLSPDRVSFAQATEHASAVMVTSNLGLPVDLRAAKGITRRRAIPLIEDCAHALYATQEGKPIGMTGDAAVFSLRKAVALPDGGALYLKAGQVRTAPPPPSPETIQRSTRKLVSLTLRIHPLAVVRAAEDLRRRMKVSRERSLPAKLESLDEARWDLQPFSPAQSDLGMSSRSLRLFRAADHLAVKAKRRRHYAMLEAARSELRGFRLMGARLDHDACPPSSFPSWSRMWRVSSGLWRMKPLPPNICGRYSIRPSPGSDSRESAPGRRRCLACRYTKPFRMATSTALSMW